MKSRKEKFRKKPSNGAKLLFGTLFLSIGLGSSITIAFADQDIHGLLSDWFAKQQTTSIETIEKAIMSEKEIQMQRLKEELQIEINDAKKQLEQFTEEETEQRVNDLKAHTDQLIENISIDHSEEKEAIINELDEILNESIKKMDDIRTTGDTDNINE